MSAGAAAARASRQASQSRSRRSTLLGSADQHRTLTLPPPCACGSRRRSGFGAEDGIRTRTGRGVEPAPAAGAPARNSVPLARAVSGFPRARATSCQHSTDLVSLDSVHTRPDVTQKDDARKRNRTTCVYHFHHFGTLHRHDLHQACHRLVSRQPIDVAEKAHGIGFDGRNARATFEEEHSSLRKYVSRDGSNDSSPCQPDFPIPAVYRSHPFG